MAWVRLDDHFDEHPKLAQVGPLGIALWVVGLAYCNRNLTDGFIPWTQAHALLNWEYLEPADDEGRQKQVTIARTCGMAGDDLETEYVIGLLLAANLWELRDGGYQIHDYADYQPSKAQVLEERRAARERMGKVRAKREGSSGEVRAKFNFPVPDPDPVPDPIPDPSYPPVVPPQGGNRRRRRKEPDRSTPLSGKYRDRVKH